MYSYVAYKLSVVSASMSGQVTTTFLFRRFSDFTWLEEQLIEKFPGLLIPPLPDKAALAVTGRFTAEFIAERARGVQTFLDRIAMHPELGGSSEVDHFLRSSEAELTAAKEGNSSAQKRLGETT